MTPKEFKFMVDIIERSSLKAYEEGINDSRFGKTPNTKQFVMNRQSKLVLQNMLDNFLKGK